MSLSKRAVPVFLLALFASLALVQAIHAQAPATPQIFYSDLESGPNTGGQDGQGAFVNIYGKGFGSTQGSSIVTIGGAAAQRYLTWSDTQIAFQLGNNAMTGAIAVNVGGKTSNGVLFAVRPGHIYFVSTSGSDAQSGSFGRPWQTIAHAMTKVAPGDIVYIKDGVSAATPDSSGVSLAIPRAAANGRPIALVAYPGAAVTIGSSSGQTYGVRSLNGGAGSWVLAGLTIRGGIEALSVTGTSAWRLIGNDISCPGGTGTACVHAESASLIKFLGNDVHDTGSAGSDYSSVQLSASDGVEAGWNNIGNTHGCRGLALSTIAHNRDELIAHDNYVHDAACDGISLTATDPSQGVVLAYNNIVEHAGAGPAPTGVGSSFACIRVAGNGAGHVQVLNNTFSDCGAQGSADAGGLAATTPAVVTNNIFALAAGESYVSANTRTSDMSGSNNLFWGAGPIPAPFSASLQADPLFVDPANANFHVQPSSPAIDAGIDSGVPTDFDGLHRPQGSAYDIGAYESAGGPQPAGRLVESPAALDFGTVALGASSTQSVSVSNSSSANVTVSQMAVTGAGFSATGLNLPVTLSPGQAVSFTVTFTPQASGRVIGSVALLSNAGNSTSAVQVAGTGASPVAASPMIQKAATATALATACSTLTSSWQSSSYAAQSGSFTAQWDATPSALASAAFTGFSAKAAAAFTDNAAMVRFNIDNTIQALKGGNPDTYTADTAITYTAGTSYHFRVVLNVASHTYTVFVTPQGGTETLLASNYPFRSTLQTVTSLGFVNTILDAGSPATFCSFAITPTLGTLSATPNPLSFGNVLVGSSSTQNLTVTANTASVTISQATASASFSVTGPTLPLTLAPGQSTTFQVKFSPTATGSVTGTVSLTSNASNPLMSIALSGTGATPAGTLAASPASLSFGSVAAGSSATQNVTVTANTGGVTISQATATAGFSVSGLTLPLTLAAGQSATFQVKFSPTAAGSVTGTVSLTSNASNSPTTVALSGTGASTQPPGCSTTTASWQSSSYLQQTGTFTAQWDATPSALASANFVGFSAKAAAAFTDNAAMVRFNADNTIQALQGGNPDTYTADTAITYTAGTSYHFRVVLNVASHTYTVFVTPQGGTEILLASNYPFRSTQQTVTSLGFVNTILDVGSPATFCSFGVTVNPHSASLSWTASTSSGVTGYYVYRATQTGGPYTKLNGTPVTGTAYTDTNVVGGVTYFYVVTAVNAAGTESTRSAEVSGTIPTP